jgi:excinuclease ABC subunit B
VKKPKNSILAFLEISRRLNTEELEVAYEQSADLPLEDIPQLITQLEAQMKEAAKNLEFEEAAKYRDRIKQLRDRLTGRANRSQ